MASQYCKNTMEHRLQAEKDLDRNATCIGYSEFLHGSTCPALHHLHSPPSCCITMRVGAISGFVDDDNARRESGRRC